MNTREEYRSCMAKGMGGGKLKGLSKESRRIEFCVIAKKCSKNMPESEARIICSQPKPPKATKIGGAKKGASCEKNAMALTRCMMDHFEANDTYKKLLNVNTVGAEIANALMECSCGSKS